MRVYGNQIEPGGMELDDYRSTVTCQHCGKDAEYHSWQELECGTINYYSETNCDHCGANDFEF